MIAQNLKKSILQEAISGRLVSQIESEGTADDLLQQIAKEHREAFLAQQAKEKAEAEANGKKFTPKKYVPLTFSVISEDEQPFEIPNSWRWVRLGEISKSVLYGVSESAKISGKYKLLRITDIQNNTVVWNTVPYTDFNDDKVIQYLLEKNDILFARTGGTVGKSYLVDKCPNNAIYASYLIRVRLFNSVFAKYIKSFFESPIYWSQIIDNLSGTGQPNCNGAKLANLLIPLPPLSEQRRIVSKLESLLPKIDSLSETETRLSVLESTLGDRLWKSVVQEAIAGRLTTQLESDGTADILLDQIKAAHREAFDAEQAKAKAASEKSGKKFVPQKYTPLTFSQIPQSEIPFNIPENWKWVRLGEICYEMESVKPQGQTFKYIDVDSVNNQNQTYTPKIINTIDAPSRATRKVCKNDILFSMVRPYLKKVAIVKDDDCIASTGFYVIKPISTQTYKYLFYFLVSPYTIDGLTAFMKGDNSPSINGCNITNFPIPLPPLSEQERIVAKLDRLRGALGRD